MCIAYLSIDANIFRIYLIFSLVRSLSPSLFSLAIFQYSFVFVVAFIWFDFIFYISLFFLSLLPFCLVPFSFTRRVCILFFCIHFNSQKICSAPIQVFIYGQFPILFYDIESLLFFYFLFTHIVIISQILGILKGWMQNRMGHRLLSAVDIVSNFDFYSFFSHSLSLPFILDIERKDRKAFTT